MKYLISLVLMCVSLGIAASISNVDVNTANGGVNVAASVEGKFSSMFLGSLAQLMQANLGKSWQMYYEVELRREVSNWPDKVVAKDRYTYTIDFPSVFDYSGDPHIEVILSSGQRGEIDSTSCYSTEEVASIVYHLGGMGGSDHVLFPYQWTTDDGGRDFHVRVKASQSVPFEKDDETDWADSPSFAVAQEYCSSGEENGNVVEETKEFLGVNNAPRVPTCCGVSAYKVKVGEELEVSFQTFDPDKDDQFRITVWVQDIGARESGWLGGSSRWGSCSFTSTFSSPGNKRVVARATDDHGKASEWSEPIFITVADQ